MAQQLSILCPHCQQRLRISDPRLLGKRVKCPGCSQPVQLPSKAPAAPVRPEREPVQKPQPAPVAAAAENPLDFSPLSQPFSGGKEPARNRARRRKKWQRVLLLSVVTFVPMLVIAGVLLKLPSPKPPSPGIDKATNEWAPAPSVQGEAYSAERLRSDPKLIDEFNPTNGSPVSLQWLPEGVNLVVHFHPGWLWSDSQDAKVLRASLTDDVTGWLAAALGSFTPLDPKEIATATLGVILGPTGSIPQASLVIRLSDGIPLPQLLEKLGGGPVEGLSGELSSRSRSRGSRIAYVVDERTVVVLPTSLKAELRQLVAEPQPNVAEGLRQLLERADGDRLLTIAGTPGDIQRHLAALMPEPARRMLGPLLEGMGGNVETFTWSLHTVPYLHSDFSVRPISVANPTRLQQELEGQFAQLPQRVWKEVCLQTSPQEMRSRQFIGRLPAMLEAFRQSTVAYKGPRLVRFVTVLPAKAAPNLSLAILFTASESGRRIPAAAVAEGRGGNVPVARTLVSFRERLNQVVDVEFNRAPLEQALQYICDEMRVTLIIDGEALKDAGYTKNMPQTFTLGKVPAWQALRRIVGAYQERDKELVLSVDEKSMTITVLTKKFADATGLPVYELPQE